MKPGSGGHRRCPASFQHSVSDSTTHQSPNLPIPQYRSEDKACAEADHALCERQDVRDPAEVRVAQCPVRVGVVRPVQRVEEVRAKLGAPRFRSGRSSRSTRRGLRTPVRSAGHTRRTLPHVPAGAPRRPTCRTTARSDRCRRAPWASPSRSASEYSPAREDPTRWR